MTPEMPKTDEPQMPGTGMPETGTDGKPAMPPTSEQDENAGADMTDDMDDMDEE